MRFRLLALSAIVTTAALVACSSGGSSIPSTGSSGGGPASGGTPSGQASQAIIANDPAATTISTSSGLTVTIPANTFAAATTVTAYQYASASGLPAAAQSKSRRVAAQGRTRALSAMPAGATFLAGFAIDSGSAQPFQAIGVTETFSASVPAGDVVRVAKFGANGYTDVDTATVSGSSASNDKNVQYVSVSTGGTSEPYIFYAIASPAAPAAITITVQPQVAGQVLVPGGSINFYAQGADANGNYLPFTGVFSATPSTLATAAQTVNPNVGMVTAAAQLGSVTVTATDPRTTVSGSVSSQVLASRPGASGDTFSYSGTLNRTDVYTYPVPPLPSTNVTANVTQTVTASQTSNPFTSVTPNPADPLTASEFTTVETDTYPTQTFGTTTEAFYSTLPLTTVPGPYQLYGSASIDDAGNESITTYADGGPFSSGIFGTPQPNNPLTVDELPETAGTKWTNNPADVYYYEGIDNEIVAQQTFADGSYDAYQCFGEGVTAVQFATNANMSADYWLYLGSVTIQFTYATPAGGTITIQPNEYETGASPVPSPSGIPALAVPDWIPAGAPPYAEADIDNGPAAIPPGCNVPSTFAGTANQLNQLITQIDPVIGTITTTNTNTYVVPGFGPVCMTTNNVVQEFYDYNIDLDDTLLVYSSTTTPLQTTTTNETLGLTAANGTDVSTSASRKTESVKPQSLSLQPISAGALENARIQIAQMNQRDRTTRIKNIRAAMKTSLSAHGKGVL